MAVLNPDLLLRAYSIGVFPMADSRDAEEVFWVEPRRRAIIPLDEFRLSRSLRKIVRSGRFALTSDSAFSEVVRRCADREESWINSGIELSYNQLHGLGHAHSIECWQDGRILGQRFPTRDFGRPALPILAVDEVPALNGRFDTP